MSESIPEPLENPEGPDLMPTQFPPDEFPDPPQDAADLGADEPEGGAA